MQSAPPSALWRTMAQDMQPPKLPKGLDAAWLRFEGTVRRLARRQSRYLRRAERIICLQHTFTQQSDDQLAESAHRLRDTFRLSRDTTEELDKAFALVGEVAYRQLGLRPYREQIAGALALHDGCVAEMATGEGKTLTASLPTTIAGWRGRGCHVITVNDYLARRDAETMTPIYQFCGLRVAAIQQDSEPAERREAYAADITYCTNKEVTADFLRDRLALGRSRTLTSMLLNELTFGSCAGAHQLVMRGLEYAIVDEADSVLIDEAVTPLIISGEAPNAESTEAYQQAAQLVDRFEFERHYRVDHRFHEVRLTESGRKLLDDLRANRRGLWAGRRRSEELIVQALVARELYQPGKQYVVREGKVVIVDEFTGRLMPDRTWRAGLHQAIEAKEQLEIQPLKQTLARVSFQNFFRLYRRLGGMSGTAIEARSELWQIYRLPVVRIPTHRPCRLEIARDQIHHKAADRWTAVVDEIRRIHATGRPVLIGTRSVEASEQLSEQLTIVGIDHQVLNAVYHETEAQIIAQAGQAGRVTVATNMAGRGTDIKLGQGVAELGGLHVIATERHETGRVDRQLFGRAARQGDPGTAVAIISLEDELIRRHAPRWLKRFGRSSRFFTRTQRRAEAAAYRNRRAVLRTDDWLTEHLAFAAPEG
ncbi:hypothetical protein HED60_19520 [Planctomycetales bacterium ZRK34]|nr:hypothetical protein HED60_19520 [Planctomycetales bacterium ZRK34]